MAGFQAYLIEGKSSSTEFVADYKEQSICYSYVCSTDGAWAVIIGVYL